MKVIVKNTIEDFFELEQRIHNAMIQNIEDYNAVQWAEPLYSVDKTLIACSVDTEGVRGSIIQNVLKANEEIIEIYSNDEFWVEQTSL